MNKTPLNKWLLWVSELHASNKFLTYFLEFAKKKKRKKVCIATADGNKASQCSDLMGYLGCHSFICHGQLTVQFHLPYMMGHGYNDLSTSLCFLLHKEEESSSWK